MANAKLSITMNRTDGTISVDSVSTKIYTRDENVDVIVNGFTTGESALVPYLQLCKRGVVMAQCSLTVPTGGDGTVMAGTMSTNTVQLVKFFNDSQTDVSRLVGCRVFATDAENPFAYGDVEVYNFPAPCGSAPDNLVSGSEALEEIDEKIDDHIDDVSNPHEVTAAQVGAIALPSSSVSEGKVPISNGDGTVRWGSGGGSGGTSNYNELSNKPQIDGITLSGNKTASDLSLVATNDSRLTDARTPTAHKDSHKTNGSDQLSPSDIGAAAAATTLAGYGITDAKIENGKITLGSVEITPLTSHQDISGKVDKESGKGLSTNDYTTAEKTKLAGIYTGATAVSVSASGTATGDEVQYITINGTTSKIAGGTSGTSNYDDLTNKPQIGGVTLQGNKTIEEIGAIGKSSSIPSLGEDPTEDEVIAALKAIRALCSSN